MWTKYEYLFIFVIILWRSVRCDGQDPPMFSTIPRKQENWPNVGDLKNMSLPNITRLPDYNSIHTVPTEKSFFDLYRIEENQSKTIIEVTPRYASSSEAIPISILARLKRPGSDPSKLLYRSTQGNLYRSNIETPGYYDINDRKRFPRNIIRTILRRMYNYAELMFDELSPGRQEKVGADLFALGDFGFSNAIDFAVALTNIDSSANILTGLFKAMEMSPDEKDAMQYLILCQTFESEVSRQTGDETHAKILHVLQNRAGEVASDFLVNAMRKEKYAKNINRIRLSDSLAAHHPEINANVMRTTVKRAFSNILPDKIFANIMAHTNLEQRIVGLLTLLHIIKNENKLDETVTFEVVAAIAALDSSHYYDLEDEIMEEIEYVKRSLPDCLRNLLFEQTVCLHSKVHEEYLFAANSTFNYDERNRRMFTWGLGIAPFGGYWMVEKMGKHVFFKNQDYRNEYLYAADVDYNNELRHIFTSVPKESKEGRKFAWQVEIRGHSCYFRNVNFNEYLFASFLVNGDMRSVFTWRTGQSFQRSENMEWQVHRC